MSDKTGLPTDVLLGSGKRHDNSFVDQHLKNTAGRRRKVLNQDKIYVSLEMRRALRRKGIRVNMKMRNQGYRRKRGPKFKLNDQQYRVRFLIEKTFPKSKILYRESRKAVCFSSNWTNTCAKSKIKIRT